MLFNIRTSFFYDIDEYCETPVQTWDKAKLEELTIKVIEGIKIPEEFRIIVENSYYEKIAAITRFEAISNEISN